MNNHLSLVARDHAKDAGLARRALSGDRAAQHELLRALRNSVHTTLYRVLGGNEHMEELLQDSFVEIFRCLPQYRADSQLEAWGARIAARVALQHLKHGPAKKDRDRPAPVQLHLVPPPGDGVHREGMRRYYAVLRRMQPELHVALALVMVDGRSLEEVSEITGMTITRTKHRLHRARRKLWDNARRDPLLMSYMTRAGAAG